MTWCMRCGSYHLFGACLTAKERAERNAARRERVRIAVEAAGWRASR